MEEVNFNGFIFEIDKEETKLLHEKRIPATIECGCGDCLDFNREREKIFPKEIIKILEIFGIDYRKEDYFATYGKFGGPYDIAYYVKGIIKKKGEEFISIAPLIGIRFEDKNLPTNFLPKGLTPPYFEIYIMVDKEK